METWKSVPGWEGLYEASTDGRVRSLQRKAKSKAGSDRTVPSTIRKPSTQTGGYGQVVLHKNGRRTRYALHRLILFTFVGDPGDSRIEANHKNGIKSDNRLSNLEWVTKSENIRHSIDVIGRKFYSGESNPAAKLTLEDIKEIRVKFSQGSTMRELAIAFGVCDTQIRRIVRRIQWKTED